VRRRRQVSRPGEDLQPSSFFSVLPGFFFCHSGESRNPSFSCALGIAKEREARAFYAGFRLSSLCKNPASTQRIKPTPPFLQNRSCKNSENPDPHEKLPTGMANIGQKPYEIPTRTLISYDFEHYFLTL